MERPKINSSNRNNSLGSTDFDSMFPANKQLLLFVTGWFIIKIFAAIVQAILMGSNLAIGNAKTYNVSVLTNFLAYMATLATIIAVCNNDLKRVFGSFTKYQSYIAGAACFIIILIFSNLYGNFIKILNLPTAENTNQAAIESNSAAYPFSSIIIFGLFAPICEEFTYRVGLFDFFKRRSRALAYTISVIVFALIHFTFDFSSTTAFLVELINLPFYIFAGLAFTFTYEKFGLAGSLTAHAINNVLSLTIFSVLL
jgi:membrane protease YdiL (CAAX protease family)